MRQLYFPLFLFLSLLFLDACTYTQKIKDGKTAFEQKQYAVAGPMLEKEFNRTKDVKEKAKIAYLAGESFDRMNNAEKALEWYLKAHKNRYGEKATHKYAFALKQAEMYAEAADMFRELEAESTSMFNYRKETEACIAAVKWNKEKNDNLYKVQQVGFNSSDADYSPTIYEDGRLVISSDRPSSTGEESYKWTGNEFSDLFIVDPESGTVELLPGVVNSEFNEGTVAFNADFSEMIFSRCGTAGEQDDYCKLMKSTRDGNNWTKPEILPFVMDKVNYAHPSWSSDGKVLYFVCDADDGWGGFDIYEINRSQSGWGEPRILSAIINTEMDDMFPSFDGDTLYFASDGRGGMGGLDIYKTYQTQPGKWKIPENLKAPINSGRDDFGMVITKNLEGQIIQEGYFTSTRMDGVGGDDIYAFSKKKPKPVIKPEPMDTPKVVIPEPVVEKDIYLEVYVYGKTYTDPNNPKSSVSGKVALPDTRLQISHSSNSESVQTDENGKYRFKIEKELDYRFFASSSEYYNKSAVFNTVNQADTEVYRLEIILDKIFKNVEIKLDNIYYDFDKWDIREDAKPTLNKLATTLLQNPEISIILGSHTDCRGKEGYNQELSQKRAQSAVDYLVTFGVSANRLQASGYGESSPAVSCSCNNCSEDEHQANRRTTFKILDQ